MKRRLRKNAPPPNRPVPPVSYAPDVLLRELVQATRNAIGSSDPIPTVLLLEGSYGQGKTYAVQRLFDALAAADSGGYWRPGLSPNATPPSEEALMISRKRIADPALCNPQAVPVWFWIGVPCGTVSSGTILGDPLLAAFHWQLEQHVRLFDVRGGGIGAASRHASTIAAEITTATSEHLVDHIAGAIPWGTVAMTLFRVAKEVVSAVADARTRADEVEDLQQRSAHDVILNFIDRASAARVTTIVVLDDAHRCTANTLLFLSRALTNRTAEVPSHYFEPQGPAAARRRLLVIATAWPREQTQGEFWTWFAELRKTGVRVNAFQEAEGWLPGLQRDDAVAALAAFAPRLPAAFSLKIIDAGLRRDRINPLLLRRYATLAVEGGVDEGTDIDAWLSSLPPSLEDIQQRRFGALASTEQDAARIAASLGPVFATRVAALAIAARRLDIADAVTPLAALVDHQYLSPTSNADQVSTTAFHEELMFSDEADFEWLQPRLRPLAWITRVRSAALTRWYDEVLLALTRDLEGGGSPLSLRRAAMLVESSLRCYASDNSRRGPTDLFVWGIQRILRRGGEKGIPTLADASGDSRAFVFAAAATRPTWLAAECLSAAWIIAKAEGMHSRCAVVLAGRILTSSMHQSLWEDAKALLFDNRRDVQAARLFLLLCGSQDPSKARMILEMSPDRPDFALQLFGLIRGTDPPKARALLERFPNDPASVMALSRFLEDKDPAGALRVLQGLADSSGPVAIALSRMLREHDTVAARAVLERVADDPAVAVELARLIGDAEPAAARRILEATLPDPHAAIELARLVGTEDPKWARRVLQDAAMDPHAAVALSRLIEKENPEEARHVLERVAADPHVAVELADLLGQTDFKRAREILERFPNDPQVVIALARLLRTTEPALAEACLRRLAANSSSAARELSNYLSGMGRFSEAYEAASMAGTRDAAAALLMARNAVGAQQLAEAQAIVAQHLEAVRTRDSIFHTITKSLGSSEAILRVLPRTGSGLGEYFQFLKRRALDNAQAAFLLGCLTRDVFPSWQILAKQALFANARQDACCASVLCDFPLGTEEATDLLVVLASHANAGNRRAVFELGRLARRMHDEENCERAIAMMELRPEFSDEERLTYLALTSVTRLQFTNLREERQPWGATTIWAATLRGKNASGEVVPVV